MRMQSPDQWSGRSPKRSAAGPSSRNTTRSTASPQTIKKDVREILEISTKESAESKGKKKRMSAAERQAMIQQLTLEMQNAAKMLEFEHAAYLRDKIKKLKEQK